MSVLVAVVSHPHNASAKPAQPDLFGFRALKPAIAAFPQFLEMLVSRLSSADHALCTNALQLINSLMRDAITNGAENEWPKFIKRLQDLGVIRAVYGLMQSSALQDLAQPLLDFQALTKVLLRKWRDVAVDFDKPEHRRAIRGIYQASKSEKRPRTSDNSSDYSPRASKDGEKWKRLGFETATPALEFEGVGFLGMMDLSDYVRRNEDGFQKLVLEALTQSAERRCPIARASIAVTSILYEHFEIDKADVDDAKGYLALDARDSIEHVFKPLLLQWSKLHAAGLQAFLRLWKATGANAAAGDLPKTTELVRILLEAVVGAAPRTRDVQAVEDEVRAFDVRRLRALQMEMFELSYEDLWGAHLRQVRDELRQEALHFVKEQRIRCLLAGAWFPLAAPDARANGAAAGGGAAAANGAAADGSPAWRYVMLSHNRRWLHYGDYARRAPVDPPLDALADKIDLSTVLSVVSNVAARPRSRSSSETLRLGPANGNSESTADQPPKTGSGALQTRIVIHGYAPGEPRDAAGAPAGRGGHAKSASNASSAGRREVPLLSLQPTSHVVASEWLDGLLMLLSQEPITAETKKLLTTIDSWGLKIRLLNVRYDEGDEMEDGRGVVPSREGLDEDYYYNMGS